MKNKNDKLRVDILNRQVSIKFMHSGAGHGPSALLVLWLSSKRVN